MDSKDSFLKAGAYCNASVVMIADQMPRQGCIGDVSPYW